ncbi:hypothetical protein VKT23_007873 [Stygiomarasmius scandens]|uniref:Uncharacterized protein n=1 Tax=Marasmiellus scandens TaxID=2682957 RepID=A0ABR1JJG8_9AGAR
MINAETSASRPSPSTSSDSTAPSERQSGIPNNHLENAQGQSQQQSNTRVPWPQISPDRETDSSLHTLLSILSEEKHLSEESAQDLHRFGMANDEDRNIILMCALLQCKDHLKACMEYLRVISESSNENIQ